METTNPRILDFYKNHPEIDFENVNLIIIDLLEKLISQNTNNSINPQMMKEHFQDPMATLITSCEERIINSLKNAPRKQIHNSGYQFKYILNQLYCSSDVMQMANTFGLYTLVMKRPNKPTILFANKDNELNIETDDIHNFTRFVEEHNCHGIFVSQNSGISSKNNYHIDYLNGNMIVYIQNTEYSPDKIKIAIDIIDNLSGKLQEFNKQNDENSIPTSVLNDINKEYQLLISQKEALVGVYKDCQKKVLSQIDELRFPCLDKYLSTKFTTQIQKQGFKCDLCKAFNANNLKALAAHKRGCVRKNNNVAVVAQH
jgi:hypothetical protein